MKWKMYFGRGSNNVIECRLERERSVEQSGPDGKQNSSDLCGYLPGYGLFEVPACKGLYLRNIVRYASGILIVSS